MRHLGNFDRADGWFINVSNLKFNVKKEKKKPHEY